MKANTVTIYFFMLVGVILSSYFGPWWASAAFVVLISLLMQLPTKKAFVAGAISIGVVYLVMAIWMNSGDKTDIIGKTGMLMGGLSSTGLIVITGLIGMISGGLAGWIGSALRAVFRQNNVNG